jgi:hypothetical protein
VRSQVEVRADFDLPVSASGGSAPSYSLSDRPGTDEVATTDTLSQVLGLAGHEAHPRDPVAPYGAGHGRRTFTDGDRALVVGPGAGRPWAYTRDGIDCSDVDVSEAGNLLSCLPYRRGAWSPDAPPSTPLTDAAARRAAAPVLRAVGIDPEAAEVLTGWRTSVVTVDPSVAGLPTSGMATSVVVDADGVLAAAGWLGAVARGPDYPVLGPAETIDLWRGGRPATACPSVLPAGARRPEECDRPEVRVAAATRGLMRWSVHGVSRLVPAWILSGTAGGEDGWRASLPAVTPSHLPPGLLPPTDRSG